MDANLLKDVYSIVETTKLTQAIETVEELELEVLIFENNTTILKKIYELLLVLYLLNNDSIKIQNLHSRIQTNHTKAIKILFLIHSSLEAGKLNQILPYILQYEENIYVAEYNRVQPNEIKTNFDQWPSELQGLLTRFLLEFQSKLVRSISILFDKISLSHASSLLGLSQKESKDIFLQYGWTEYIEREGIDDEEELIFLTEFQDHNEIDRKNQLRCKQDNEHVIPIQKVFHNFRMLQGEE
ncbi:hypothetical protein K502DRAFT_351672 [Neoconidiobolus thromboides FSU 785]|nr:hypothetical protein K502DRAFT_351672 [Neoconidiobolus thromboides FSU 785]